MCTVTFIPTTNGYIITSNRDEKIARKKAIPPQSYEINGKQIFFPKDQKAGGTWIAHTKNKIVVLLNGAEEKHIKKPSYKKSRGLIVIEIISSNNSLELWKTIDLTNIEPFTIVFFENNKLLQLQWNEIEKRQEELAISEHHIWSSSTLYSKEIRIERAKWFANFMLKNTNPTTTDILNFHLFTESENEEFGLQINRNNLLKTISITQCFISENKIQMSYLDLMENHDQV
ncbi:MAG TPA: NRDE family protein [Flavobacterium sp.]|uniref:NRDE family protein n=1 Tax=Flavobacterium sp. TaxID=239 RepID=UPI002B4B95C7|nr:NRDE family protein [Flavobacterium sp.]HLO73321.1 NRDE family protein [Flavobacterium sp.]